MKKAIFKPKYKCNMFGVEHFEGETIETKCQRITLNKEPISDGAPIIFTERKDGVLPEYNVRTDRWEIAQDAMEKVYKAKIAKSENKPEEQKPTEQKPTEQKPAEQKQE